MVEAERSRARRRVSHRSPSPGAGAGRSAEVKSHPTPDAHDPSNMTWDMGASHESAVSQDESDTKKRRNLYNRVLAGSLLVVMFVAIIYLGHLPCLLLVLFLQIFMAQELFALARMRSKSFASAVDERADLPFLQFHRWYLFVVATFYVYTSLLRDLVLQELSLASSTNRVTKTLKAATVLVLRRTGLITYTLYLAGFLLFVSSLKKGKYRYQLGQYAWATLIILWVLVQTSFFVSSIFDGLIWFVLPCSLVIINDIMAYVWGKLCGRTPLITLSPKKTWEGFIGGGAATVLASVPLTTALAKYQWLTCPASSFTIARLECKTPDIYLPYTFHVLDYIPSYLLGPTFLPEGAVEGSWVNSSFTTRPILVHAVVLAVFASMIAPFGGFFASGIKRALKIKDFGATIPGHGGLSDRMDCQCMMALFAYIYFKNFVQVVSVSVGDLMDKVYTLEPEDQLALFTRLGYLLAGQDKLPPSAVTELNRLTTQ